MGRRDLSAVALSMLIALGGCTTSQQTFINKAEGLADVQVCRNYLADKEDLYNFPPDADEKTAAYSDSLQREFFRRGLTERKCEVAVREHNKKVAAGVTAAVAIGAITYAIVKDAKDCDKDPKCRRTGGGGISSRQTKNTGPRNNHSTASSGNKSNAFGGAHAWDYYYDDFGNEVKRCRSTKTGQLSSNSNCLLSPRHDGTWPDKSKNIRVGAKLNSPYLTSQKMVVGGSICTYDDGTAMRVSGPRCPLRNNGSETVELRKMAKQKLNRAYLVSQDPIIGGTLCKYSDGSVVKVGGSYCELSRW